MIRVMLLLMLLIAEGLFAVPVKEDTAVTVIVGPFVDYADGKTILSVNDDFDPDDIVCRLIKGSSESTLTLTKTGGDNNINLTGYGMATLTLTAANVDTAGILTLSFCDATVDGYATATILPFSKSFTVYPANVYDSLFADNTAISKFDVSSDTVIVGTNSDKSGYSLATDQAVNVTKIAGAAVNTASAQLGVNVVSISPNAITATSIASSAITSTKIASNAIGASQIASNAITSTKVSDGFITASKISAAALNGKGDWNTVTPDPAGTSASLFSVTNGKIDTIDGIVDNIKLKTDGLNFTGTDVKATLDGEAVVVGTNNDKAGYSISGTKQTLDALNDFDPTNDTVSHVTLVDTTTTNTDVRSAVDASIEYYRLDHLLLNGGTLTDFVNDQTVMAWLMAADGDISDFNATTDSLKAVRNQVDKIPTKPSRPGIQ